MQLQRPMRGTHTHCPPPPPAAGVFTAYVRPCRACVRPAPRPLLQPPLLQQPLFQQPVCTECGVCLSVVWSCRWCGPPLLSVAPQLAPLQSFTPSRTGSWATTATLWDKPLLPLAPSSTQHQGMQGLSAAEAQHSALHPPPLPKINRQNRQTASTGEAFILLPSGCR